MARKYFLPLTDVRAKVGASTTGKMSLILPTDRRINKTATTVTKGGALATLAQMRAAIGEISLFLGNTVISNCSALELLAILEANGYTIANGLLPEFYAQNYRALVLDEEVLSLELRGYKDARIDFEVINDATALDFKFDSKVAFDQKIDPATQKEIRLLNVRDRQVENLSGGRVQLILNKMPGQLQRMFIFTPSGVTLSKVEMKRGQTTEYEIEQVATNPGLAHQLADAGMKIPTAGIDPYGTTWNCWPLVLDNNQQLRDGEPTPNGLELWLTLSGAAQVKIVRECLINA